jgi:hypothetical protein
MLIISARISSAWSPSAQSRRQAAKVVLSATLVAEPNNRPEGFGLAAEIEIEFSPREVAGFGEFLHGQCAIAVCEKRAFELKQQIGRGSKLLAGHSRVCPRASRNEGSQACAGCVDDAMAAEFRPAGA